MKRKLGICLVLAAACGCVGIDPDASDGPPVGRRVATASPRPPLRATWAPKDAPPAPVLAADDDDAPPAPKPEPVKVKAPALTPAVVRLQPLNRKPGAPALTPADGAAPMIVKGAPADGAAPVIVKGVPASAEEVDTNLINATLTEAPHDRADGDAPPARTGAYRENTVGFHPAPAADATVGYHPAPAADATVGYHPAPAADAAESTPAAPAPQGVRMVNSKRITLNFEVKDAGGSGLAGVDLWCTQDTRAWKRCEIVAQTAKSYVIEVKDEGLYGFTLLAHNGGKDAPLPGEEPQVWVMVDVTKPVVQLTSLEWSQNGGKPTLDIHWSARHKHLGARPITLSYGEQLDGPWTTIAGGLENTGHYDWRPPTNAPRRVFLRVEAADLTGNIGVAQTTNPLRLEAVGAAVQAGDGRKALPAPPAIDGAKPTASILAIEPTQN